MTQARTIDSEWAGVLARHLADAAAADGDLDAAEARVAAALPPEMRAEVAAVARVVREGRAALDVQGKGAAALLGLVEILEQAPAGAARRARVLQGFEESRRELTPALLAVQARIAHAASYLTLLGGAFLLVLGLIWIYVLPQFAQLYDGFGMQLPQLTRLVFGGGPVVLILVLAIGSAILGSQAFRWHVARRIRELRPLAPRLLTLPLLRAPAYAYNSLIYLCYARVLARGGVPLGDAHAHAATASGIALATEPSAALEGRALEIAGSFAIADALGRGAEELDHQYANGSRILVATFDATTARVEALFKLVFAITVGILVIAVYLPIFKLGSIV